MPINTTGVSKNFLPMFTPSGNLASDMRKIEIAKSISFAWLKGQFYSNMKKAGSVINISGKEYFGPTIIRGYSYDFFNYGTRGYWTAEALRLLGYDDDSLRKLADASNGDLDNIIWVWRTDKERSAQEFSFYVDYLRQQISGIDSIEIEYELDRYKSSVYTTEQSRIYVPKTSGLPWGTECVNNPTIYQWSDFSAYPESQTIIHKENKFIWGNIKLISAGIDVTANYSTRIKNALTAMIAYSGEAFMHRTSATKIGERTYTVTIINDEMYGPAYINETFISAIGKETFDAIIKQDFVDDINEIYWRQYSAYYVTYNPEGGDEFPVDIRHTKYDVRVPLITGTYANFFWEIVEYAEYSDPYWNTPINNVDAVDGFLFKEYDRMTAVMSVEEFFKLNADEFTFYIGKYFTFDINYNNGTFLDSLLAGIGSIFNAIVGGLFDIFYSIPVLKQMMQLNTWLVNTVFNSDLSDEEVFKITVQVVIVVITLGSATAAIGAGEAAAATATETASLAGTTLTASEQLAIATANTSALTTASASLASAFGASMSTSMAFASYVNTASSIFSLYESMENIDKLDEMHELGEQQSNETILEEARQKQSEKDKLQEQLNQRMRNEDERIFNSFLEDPLFAVRQELALRVNSIDSDINKQFNLI